MSPEFTLRPSLSGAQRRSTARRRGGVAGVYPPAFVERWAARAAGWARRAGVAGVYPPAFVERRLWDVMDNIARRGVAGVYPPAFVERAIASDAMLRVGEVSPEFTLRPSLSAAETTARA